MSQEPTHIKRGDLKRSVRAVSSTLLSVHSRLGHARLGQLHPSAVSPACLLVGFVDWRNSSSDHSCHIHGVRDHHLQVPRPHLLDQLPLGAGDRTGALT